MAIGDWPMAAYW